MADEISTQLERISYARVLVEMDITRPLPQTVLVLHPNGRTFDPVNQYAWKPMYRGTCLSAR